MDHSAKSPSLLPFHMILLIFEKLSNQDFGAFYTLFVSYIQNNDIAFINNILKDLKFEPFYSLGSNALHTHARKFNHFINYAAGLNIPDAIFFVTYRELIYSEQNREQNLKTMQNLADEHAHSFAKLVVVVFKFLFQEGLGQVQAFEDLSNLHDDPSFEVAKKLTILNELQAIIHPRVSILRFKKFPQVCFDHKTQRKRLRLLYGPCNNIAIYPPCKGCVVNRMMRRITHDWL